MDAQRETDENDRINRRSVVRGAAWSVPVILGAQAIPAFAVSKLPACSTLVPVTLAYGTTQGSMWSSTSGSGVTMSKSSLIYYNTAGAVVAHTETVMGRIRTDANIGNLSATYGTQSFLELRQTLSASPAAAYGEFTIAFSAPVYGLNFYVTDIDTNIGSGVGSVSGVAYQDSVILRTAPTSLTPTISNLGQVTGNGVIGSPLTTTALPATPTSDLVITSYLGNAKASYPSSTGITSLTVRYGSIQGAMTQSVFLSPVRFYTQPCI